MKMKLYHKPLVILFVVILPQILFNIAMSNEIVSKNISIAIGIVNALIFLGYMYIFLKNQIKKSDVSFVDYCIITCLGALQTFILVEFISKGFELYKFLNINISTNLLFQIIILLIILYGITGMYICKINSDKEYSITKEGILLVIIPIVSYIVFNTVLRDRYDILDNYLSFFAIIIAYTILILAIRFCYVIFIKKKQSYLILNTIIVLIIPLTGLALNSYFGNAVADFSSIFFFVIPIINILLLFEVKDTKKRMLLFFIKSITYSYTLYFFIVFIPLYPLSLFALIFYGIGILILGPLFLMVLHTFHLINEYLAMKDKKLIGIFISGFLIIPIVLTINFLFDKPNLKLALDVMYKPYENVNLNLARLNRSTKNITSKRTSRSFFDDNNIFRGTPIITSWYNFIVAKDLNISNESIENIKKLYLNKDTNYSIAQTQVEEVSFKSVGFSFYDINSETIYDKKSKEFRSKIDLKIKSNGPAEYITNFHIPEGSYISNYYLYVANEKKYGSLTDKRISNSMYNSIVRKSLDPGIINYISQNTLELKIFPFRMDEIRESGFEIVHKEPIKITIDEHEINLSNSTFSSEGIVENENGLFIPSYEKNKLQKIEREPKYNFIVDMSLNSDVDKHVENLKAFIKNNDVKEEKICFANYEMKIVPFDDLENPSKYMDKKGGFNFNLAIKSMLLDDENGANIIVVFSDNLYDAPMVNDLIHKNLISPDTKGSYFQIDKNNILKSYSFVDNKLLKDVDKIKLYPVLKYENLYLKDDNISEVIAKKPPIVDDISLNKSDWENGFNLNLMYKASQENNNEINNIPFEIVKKSIETNVLTPLTSYIVVETDAQEEEIKNRQNKLLESNDYNSIEPVEMNEPSIFIFILVLILYILQKSLFTSFKKKGKTTL